jgi:hypothetical protein
MLQSRTTVVPPPRRGKVNSHPNSHQLWMTFAVELRERILGALTRVVARQLAKPADGKEVTHECS